MISRQQSRIQERAKEIKPTSTSTVTKMVLGFKLDDLSEFSCRLLYSSQTTLLSYV